MTIQTDGNLEVTSIMLKSSVTKTIATGVVTLTQSYSIIAAQSGTADDLDTINLDENGTYNPLFFLLADAGDTITLKDGTGNIQTPGAADVSITEDTPAWVLYDDSTDTCYVLAGGSGGGGGATTALDNLASVQLNTDIIPDADNTHDLGSSSAEFAEIWVNADHAVSRKMRVYNSTGGVINAGSWVYITGTQTVGSVTLFTVDLADRDAAASSRAIGVVDSNISTASEGIITILGEATYNTTGLSVDDILYLDSTAGAATTTRPTSGIIQELGVVGSIGASGIIAVNPGTDINLDATETLSNKTLTDLAVTDATELTIATGSVTKTQSYHTIDTESDAASDDLDTISGGTAGDLLIISAANDARTVVVKNGTGNILTYGGSDISLDEDHKTLVLKYNGTNWHEIGNAASGGGSGLYTSYAILRDEKSTTTNGGSSSATTWNARDLNTEVSDPDAIVSIASNQFTPASGDYVAIVSAIASRVNGHRLRLYNVTGTAVVDEGLNAFSGSSVAAVSSYATLYVAFTANGTDAYRIDHYTGAAQATNGLGVAVSDGSNEIYMEILLYKLA